MGCGAALSSPSAIVCISGRFTTATNDPNSAGCNRHCGRTNDSGCERPSHRSRRGSLMRDEMQEPWPLPARKLARNALASASTVRHERRESGRSELMPICSASRRPSANCIETERKKPRRSRLLTKLQPREHQDTYAVEQDQAVWRVDAAGIPWSTTIDNSSSAAIQS